MRLFLLCLLLLGRAGAAVTFPHLFSDGMVLQRDRPIPVWGWAEPGERIDVAFAGQEKQAVAGPDGKWSVNLDPLEASATPREMTIAGRKIRDVLVGEVWFCSGQSNMEMCVGPYKVDYRGVENYEGVLRDADYPRIRFFQVPHTSSGLPVSDVPAAWWKCDATSVYYSSAVAFFFGRELHRALGVPVGLINSAWGGSAIQPWTPRSGLEAVPGFEAELGQMKMADAAYAAGRHVSRAVWENEIRAWAAGKPAPPSAAWIARPMLPASGHPGNYPKPAGLYNSMVAPIVPYAIRGVIWYQGETNLGDGALYTRRLEALIAGWRGEWHEGNFPFLYVQIAPYTYRPPWPVKNPTPEMLPAFWTAQRAVLETPNTAMVETKDLGDPFNIHPRRKFEIGQRLAAAAETVILGRRAPASK